MGTAVATGLLTGTGTGGAHAGPAAAAETGAETGAVAAAPVAVMPEMSLGTRRALRLQLHLMLVGAAVEMPFGDFYDHV